MANIAPGEEVPDNERLNYAVNLSNLSSLIETLPLGLGTKIGLGGHGLSQGQRQRILIARVVYKEPQILLLDEATSSLDASNEKLIVENMAPFFEGRTVIIVAHRLSTVRHADMILVLEKGSVTESGTHDQLVERKGTYFRLIRDQLELGR
jgi:ATP-binding cassette subfamily B protein